MKNYGYSNGWPEVPAAIKRCRELGHIENVRSNGRGITIYECPICGIYYATDSSD